MIVLSPGWGGASVSINLYMMVLFARVILDLVRFARRWHPRRIVLVVDLPCMRFSRHDPLVRLASIPPLRLGGE